MAQSDRILNRRTFNAAMLGGAVAVFGRHAMAQQADTQTQLKPTWLLFTKSAGYEHSIIKRSGDAPSHLSRCIRPVFEQRGLALRESKDGTLFEPESIKQFAGFVFCTTGDLTTAGTDSQPPMSNADKTALLDAIASGTPFIGLHCASDTFPSPKGATVDARPLPQGEGSQERPNIDPYIAMLGGEFESHGDQQVANVEIVDASFPGVGTAADWKINEEWYALKNLANDIKPIHRLRPAGMEGDMYRREPYPITWTRVHGKGKVFYTALAHREETVAGEAFLNLIGGAVDWCRSA